MKDPYEVLNINPSASDEEVKKAYREMARKYHPDNYRDNPLSDLAQEKMKEVNQAYDSIMKMREGGSASRASSGSAGYSNTRPGGMGVYTQIRNAIDAGNLAAAEQMLNGLSNRTAEWYFLNGSIAYHKGWLDEAQRNYQMACSMEPANAEYRQALMYMQGGGPVNRQSNYGGGMSTCDCCSSLICADCCCECMGGNLIPCI